MTLKVDLSDFRRFAKDLKALREREIPHAVRNTLNTSAFEARKLWVGEMKSQLTLRNKFTENSARVQKASGTKIGAMVAKVGSVADYMGNTEEGTKQTARGHIGLAIPTRAAAGQVRSPKRTRTIRRANYLSAISLQGRRVTKGRRQVRNAANIAIAQRLGQTHVFLEGRKKKGIFRLEGTKKGMRVRMLYDLTKKTTKAKPRPTLGNAVRAVGPRIGRIGTAAIVDQLKRRVFGSSSRRR